MSEYINKLQREILPKINNIQNINILELGVQRGTSTNIFLKICENNDGYLTSVDIDDCSNVTKTKSFYRIHVLHLPYFHHFSSRKSSNSCPGSQSNN